MLRLHRIAPALVLTLLAARPAPAAPRWQIDARLGGAWNVPLPLVLRQEGSDELRPAARWRTNALEFPLYYSWRVTRWQGEAGWALDLTHHKLHLADPPPEIGRFAISHGYNLLTVQRLRQEDGWHYGGALGAVVAHPESEVRGLTLDEHGGLFGAGYYVSGPTAGALLGRSSHVTGRLQALGEVRLTLSYASVPIARGHARVPNLALHGTIGLGWIAWP